MPNSQRAFFSYSIEDWPTVARFRTAFDRCGLDVWVDNEQIEYGDGIVDRINEAIGGCGCAVIFHSASYAQKAWTKEEKQCLIYACIESGKEGAENRALFVIKLDDAKLDPLLACRSWCGADDPESFAMTIAAKLGVGGADCALNGATVATIALEMPGILQMLDGMAVEQLADQLIHNIRNIEIWSDPLQVTAYVKGYGQLVCQCLPRRAIDSVIDDAAACLNRCRIHKRRIGYFQDDLARGGLGIFTVAFKLHLEEEIHHLDAVRSALRECLDGIVLGARQAQLA